MPSKQTYKQLFNQKIEELLDSDEGLTEQEMLEVADEYARSYLESWADYEVNRRKEEGM